MNQEDVIARLSAFERELARLQRKLQELVMEFKEDLDSDEQSW